MRITDALLGEHGVFYAQFEHLAEALPRTRNVEEVHSLAAFLAAALGPHAHLEDELLFSALEPYLGTAGGPLRVMRSEHDEIEGALDRVQQVHELEAARNLVRRALTVAREHFAKEEHVLFPMAAQFLGDNRLAELGAAWAQRRDVMVR